MAVSVFPLIILARKAGSTSARCEKCKKLKVNILLLLLLELLQSPWLVIIMLRAVNVDDDFIEFSMTNIDLGFMLNIYLISMNFYEKSVLDFVDFLCKIFI